MYILCTHRHVYVRLYIMQVLVSTYILTLIPSHLAKSVSMYVRTYVYSLIKAVRLFIIYMLALQIHEQNKNLQNKNRFVYYIRMYKWLLKQFKPRLNIETKVGFEAKK